jgi:anti-sigma B factor antagonist
MEFTYNINERPGYCAVRLQGNLIEKGQAVKLIDDVNDLVLKDANRFVIDLSDFKYMNSTGLTVLLNILTLARKSGGEAVICHIPDKINTLLSITKLNNIFKVAETEKQAAESLA